MHVDRIYELMASWEANLGVDDEMCAVQKCP